MLRAGRIAVSLLTFVGLTAAVAAGYATVLTRMQIVPAIMSCAVVWLAAWAAVTSLFGRVYCSSVCPLGTLQDVLIYVSRRRRRGFFYRAPRTALRWCVVAVVVGSALLGFGVVTSLFDPYSAYSRMVVYIAMPAVKPVVVSLAAGGVAALTLVAVAVCALLSGRYICTSVCPVGTLLGALSRYSLYRIDINTDLCLGCNECVRRCKAGCIDPASHTVDVSRCVVCFDCTAVCPGAAITYRRGRHRLRMPMLEVAAGAEPARCDAAPVNRREFLAALMAAGGVLTAASAGIGGRRHQHGYVRPPGSVATYTSRCTSCGACVSACPTGVLVPSTGELGWRSVLHPVMDFDRAACMYDCTACTRVCPTGALEPLTVGEKHRYVIGKARLEPQLCLMYADGAHCGACVRRCPTGALGIVTDERGRRLPQVVADTCIGCGQCRNVCPAHPAAWIIESR